MMLWTMTMWLKHEKYSLNLSNNYPYHDSVIVVQDKFSDCSVNVNLQLYWSRNIGDDNVYQLHYPEYNVL